MSANSQDLPENIREELPELGSILMRLFSRMRSRSKTVRSLETARIRKQNLDLRMNFEEDRTGFEFVVIVL